jgi:small subunit ribosomal protein S20
VPNIKAAIKWTRASAKRRLRNTAALSKLKTLVKKASSQNAGSEALAAALSALDKAAARGIIHKNAAGRTKSRLVKRVAKGKSGG